MKARVYWAIVAVFIVFGCLAIFSIGAPFLLVGILLAVLFPWRKRRGVLLTGIAVVLGLVAGFVLVAPLGCTGTTTAVSVVGGARSDGTTTCSNPPGHYL